MYIYSQSESRKIYNELLLCCAVLRTYCAEQQEELSVYLKKFFTLTDFIDFSIDNKEVGNR